jgi:hypothetical protein
LLHHEIETWLLIIVAVPDLPPRLPPDNAEKDAA